MVTFTITAAAMAQLQWELRGSSQSVIVSLIYSSPATPASPALADALASGASDDELIKLALASVVTEGRPLQYKLLPARYDREDVPSDHLVQVEGITFSFSPEIQALINGGVLDSEAGALLLTGKDGKVVLPPTMDGPVLPPTMDGPNGGA
jgi:hypothetical protein